MSLSITGNRVGLAVMTFPSLLLASAVLHLLTLRLGYGWSIGLAASAFFCVALWCDIHRDHNLAPSFLTHWRWWYWLWAFSFFSGLIFRVRSLGDLRTGFVDAWAIYRSGLVLVVALLLIGAIATRQVPTRTFLEGPTRFLVFYCSACVLSTAWSLQPLWTLYKSFEYATDVALAGVIAASIGQVRQLRGLFSLTWLLAGLSVLSVWLGVILWPETAIRPGVGQLGLQIHGVFPAFASNTVGDLGALLVLVGTARLLLEKGRRYFYIATCILGALTLAFSQSRSPLLGLCVGVAILLVFSRRYGLVVANLVGALALGVSGLGPWLWKVLERGQSQEELLSLTGRVLWWAEGTKFLAESPLGGGAYAGARFGVLARLGNDWTATIHNNWLEVLLGTGILGLVPLLTCFLLLWWILLSRFKFARGVPEVRSLHAEALAVFGLLTVRSMFDTNLIWHPALPFLLVVIYASWLQNQFGRCEGVPDKRPRAPGACRQLQTSS